LKSSAEDEVIPALAGGVYESKIDLVIWGVVGNWEKHKKICGNYQAKIRDEN